MKQKRKSIIEGQRETEQNVEVQIKCIELQIKNFKNILKNGSISLSSINLIEAHLVEIRRIAADFVKKNKSLLNENEK